MMPSQSYVKFYTLVICAKIFMFIKPMKQKGLSWVLNSVLKRFSIGYNNLKINFILKYCMGQMSFVMLCEEFFKFC